MSKVDTAGLALLIQEAGALSKKPRLTSQEERRSAWLLAAIASVKQGGITAAELLQEEHNERSAATGLPVTQFANKSDIEKQMRSWQRLLSGERRDMVEGAPMLNHFGTFTSLGYFVPNHEFFPGLFKAMKQHDVLVNEEDCTVIRSTNGRPLPVPVAGDTTNVASVIGESASQSSVNLDSTGAAILGAYSYRTPEFRLSIEAFQDIDLFQTAMAMFSDFAADRLARGIGADLLTGSGSGKTLGLLTSLAGLGLPLVTAAGSAANDGSTNTGANSLGSADFSAVLAAIDEAYLSQPKCAWVMNLKTLANVADIKNKFGNPIELVKYRNGKPEIYGIPIKISPSMPNIGAGNVPVLLGDFAYWCSRLIQDENSGVMLYKESGNLVEKGEIALKVFARADGVLAYTDTSSPAPFVQLVNHS